MKKGIHPEEYRLVAFKDMSNDHVFLCRSAVSTKETIEVNGETYPVYKMEISNTSHPFYTGKMKLVDTAGRVDKFMSRYANATIRRTRSKHLANERTDGPHDVAVRLFLCRDSSGCACWDQLRPAVLCAWHFGCKRAVRAGFVVALATSVANDCR